MLRTSVTFSTSPAELGQSESFVSSLRAALPRAGSAVSPDQLGSPTEEDASAAARISRLSPAAEQALLSFFALQDTLSREAAHLLAEKVPKPQLSISHCVMPEPCHFVKSSTRVLSCVKEAAVHDMHPGVPLP